MTTTNKGVHFTVFANGVQWALANFDMLSMSSLRVVPASA